MIMDRFTFPYLILVNLPPKYLMSYTVIILRLDTQGYDEKILSRVSIEAWPKIRCAIIETWALSEVCQADVHQLITI